MTSTPNMTPITPTPSTPHGETADLRAENTAAKTLIKTLEHDLKWARNELECGAKNAQQSCLELFQQRDEARAKLTAAEATVAAKDAEIARLKIFEKWCQSNEVAEALEDVKLYRKTFETSVSKSVYDAANDALLASRRACEEAVGDARFWKNLHEMRLVEIPEPKNPTLWRYLEDSNNNGVIDYHIRAQKMPDGGFHFYIHAAQASSSTEDFYIWPDPFNWHDMVANTKDIPEPDVESFKKALAKAKLAPAPAGGSAK